VLRRAADRDERGASREWRRRGQRAIAAVAGRAARLRAVRAAVEGECEAQVEFTVRATMKCPACVAAGLVSRFNEHQAPKQNGTVERFFDEDGRRHVHDTTLYTFVMACSNDHAFTSSFRSRCPCKDCAWNDMPLVQAGSAPISLRSKTVARPPEARRKSDASRHSGISSISDRQSRDAKTPGY
jgi:hypothetical protein